MSSEATVRWKAVTILGRFRIPLVALIQLLSTDLKLFIIEIETFYWVNKIAQNAKTVWNWMSTESCMIAWYIVITISSRRAGAALALSSTKGFNRISGLSWRNVFWGLFWKWKNGRNLLSSKQVWITAKLSYLSYATSRTSRSRRMSCTGSCLRPGTCGTARPPTSA